VWDCKDGPALITDYNGTPTPFGVGFRNHLRRLG
jgi:endoglucanase